MESAKWLYLIVGIIIFIILGIVVKKYDLINRIKRVNCVDLDNFEEKKLTGLGKLYIKALGGEKNIESLDPCMTRIRVIVKDGNLIDEKRIIVLGAQQVIKLTDKKIHIIIGMKAEKLAKEINEIRKI